jgi:hypothetical protein
MEPVVSAASDPDDFQSVVSEGTLLGPATHTQSSVLGPLLDGLFGRELLPEQRPPLLPAPASFEDLPRSNDDAAPAALLPGQQYMVLPGLVTTEHLVGFKGIFFRYMPAFVYRLGSSPLFAAHSLEDTSRSTLHPDTNTSGSRISAYQ